MRLLKSVRSQLGNYHLKSGIYHFYRNEFKQAIEFFAKALQNPEKLDDADLRMTRYYLTQTHISAGEEAYRAGLEAAARGDLAETSERMQDAFLRRPQSFAYHYRRGLRALKDERYEEAVEDLKQAVLFNSRFADVHNYLGVAYGEIAQRPAAIAEFRRAIECNPDYLAARLNLAFTLAEGNEIKEAVAELNAILFKEPRNQAARQN